METKDRFRNEFLKFFNDPAECHFTFYKSTLPREQYESFVNNNFRLFNGKCFITADKELLIAIHSNDDSLVKENILVYNLVKIEL